MCQHNYINDPGRYINFRSVNIDKLHRYINHTLVFYNLVLMKPVIYMVGELQVCPFGETECYSTSQWKALQGREYCLHGTSINKERI